jgi:RND family efflux transporter MFP subunit
MTLSSTITSLPSRFFALRFGFLPAPLRPLSPVLVLLLVAGVAVFALRGAPKKQEDKGDGLKRVQIMRVQIAPIDQPRTLVGTLRARVESDLGFRVAGKIAERRVQAGEAVKAGQVLAVLDATDFRLSRESAEAELAAARSSAKQQELDFARISELRTRGFATQQAEDKQRAALDEARGRLERATKQVQLAANSQGYAELKADANGIVSGLFAEAGQVVAAGQSVVRLARDGEREALVAVPEQDIAFVREARGSVTLWSEAGKVYGASLRELSPNADTATRTFLARYSVQGLAPDAPLGMTVTLTLAGREAKSGMRVPLSALLNEGGGPEVFVLSGEGNTLSRKKVTLIGYDGRDALIASGLENGERVVTLGVHTLKAGDKVVPLPETARKG